MQQATSRSHVIWWEQKMREREQTRQEIIRTAAPIFNQKGYEGAALSDLMAATGLQKGGIYQKPVPIDGAPLHALEEWSRQTLYRQNDDWLFASPDMGGKQSYWPETLLKCHVQPAAKRGGITKRIGWHCFRRTFATLLFADRTA
jgi:site-specific recombinase XerD